MAKILDREATIKTALVEIKALTVGGRQVTQSLFRQLPSAALVDDNTLKLNGVPWGHVRYHLDCTHDGSPHLHVVWQDGERLCRALVYRKRGTDLAAGHRARAEEQAYTVLAHEASIVEPLIGETLASSHVYRGGLYYPCLPGAMRLVGRVEVTSAPRKVREEMVRYWAYRAEGRSPSFGAVAQSLLDEGCIAADWQSLMPEDCLREARALLQRAEETESSYLRVYRSLEALDQLFIAV